MFVRYFDFYDGAYFPFMGVDYPLWYALQHISSIVGLTAIAFYIALQPPRKSYVHGGPTFRYWLLLLLITAVVVGLRFQLYSRDYNLGNLVVSAITGLCVALVICGLMHFPGAPSPRK